MSKLEDNSTTGFGKLLMVSVFEIPRFQRDYSWDENRVRRFFNDINQAFKGEKVWYFLGMAVFQKPEDEVQFEDRFLVLDGQQRITTALLYISAIRNWLLSYSSDSAKITQGQLEERYLGSRGLGETDLVPKITLNTLNDEDFRKYIIKPCVSTENLEKEIKGLYSKDKRRSLLSGYLTADKTVKSIAEKFKTKEEAKEYFCRFVEYLKEKVRVLTLTVPDTEAAYSVFETLNDRGLALAPLDLIKNHLFGEIGKMKNSGRDLEMAENRWNEMISSLSSSDPGKFIKAYWVARHGVLEAPTRIFSAFKERYDTAAKAREASISMKNAADIYSCMEDSESATWEQYSEKARNILRSLRIIGATQVHPVLLALLMAKKKWRDREVEKLLRVFEIMLVRYQLVGRKRPGILETIGGRVGHKISSDEISTVPQIINEYKAEYPSDDDFHLNFSEMSEVNAKKARYLLRSLEISFRADDPSKVGGDELSTSLGLSLEHVIPKKPESNWRSEIKKDPDLIKECVNRLGNMTLMNSANATAKNSCFKDKKPLYAKSDLIITKELAKRKNFDRSAVDERQKWMAEKAVAVWRFPNS